jgi:3(or 17)beta-hydroxysteroid dehydrogenase
MVGRVKDKVALVTGAAMGLGRAASLLLASEGASIVVTDIDEASGQDTARMITEAGAPSLFLRHDVSCEDDWLRAMGGRAKIRQA